MLLLMLLQLSQFFPLVPLHPVPILSSNLPRLSSCSWVMHISFLASSFPILFCTSPCLFCTYHLCFLFPASFPLFSPFHFPADNRPNDLRIYDSVPVLLVCLVCFLDSLVDSCEFVVILMFTVLIFFFLYSSL